MTSKTLTRRHRQQAGTDKKRAPFCYAMTWQCDSDIFPKETGDRLAKRQATKQNQDPPWKASIFVPKGPKAFRAFDERATNFQGGSSPSAQVMAGNFPAIYKLIDTATLLSSVAFPVYVLFVFFSVFLSPFVSFKIYQWNIKGIFLFRLGHALVWENGRNNFVPTTDWWRKIISNGKLREVTIKSS